MTLSPRVGGATSKPVDVSPSPIAQRFASNSCVTTKMTYEFFNELIENFTLAQVAYGVTNVPNDPNALKKLLDSLRTGSYNFTIGTLGMGGLLTTNNNGIHLGTGLLSFTGVGNDYITFNDADNTFSFFADASVGSSKILCGELKVEIDAQGVISDTNGIKFYQNADTSRGTFINSRGNVIVNIDSANLNTDKVFYIKKNDDTNGGTNLFSVQESGLISTYNGDIHLGTGDIHFDNYDSDYMYHDEDLNQYVFVCDGSVNNSIIRAGNANFGNENLSLYRENVTFTATFFNGTTQITGSSGTTNVSSYDARFSRIGNIVTVNISNIVLDVSGACGTTLGTYPALTTTGEFSIRGLPYNALKDSFGSYIGFYNGSGNSNAGTVYIISGTNNIRFSTTGFSSSFGIRGVTITYMV